MKTLLAGALALIFSVGLTFVFAQLVAAQASIVDGESETKTQIYDGRWWLAADADERSGFLSGAADCLTSVAHARWLTFTVQGLDAKIGEYYKSHPSDVGENVADVWRKIQSESQPSKGLPGAEVWKNPHGYLDGFWWRQGSESENRGFLEGYLWCVRTCVKQRTDTYSQSLEYYADKISGYVRAHPKAEHEAVATILLRFRDRSRTE